MAIDDVVVIPIKEQGASKQTGVAWLMAKGSQTEVTVMVSSGGAGVAQPAHIHSGSCGASLGGVVYGLSNVVDGKSVSMVNATLASIRNGNTALNLHKSGQEVSVYTACGGIPTAADSVTIALKAQGGSGQDGYATLASMGAQTEVTVNVKAGGAGVAQPAHIHTGSCGASLGGVVYGLSNVTDGWSVSMVNATLASIRTGNTAINAHKSGQEVSVYTSCGEIPK